MERDDSISKVTVEYHDPSGVFPLVSRQLQSQLPLRDLNWKSSARPLRSIDALHLEFVAARDSQYPGGRQGTPGGEDGSPVRTPGERRHQIPGLRRTPYLKIYLLRCDDGEAYKSTARKNVREWLRTNTPASQSSSSRSSQENHDAFEWLIVHVVLPKTGAALQLRAGNSSSKAEAASAEKSGSSNKLLGRSSSSIIEKLRADFNVSSKTAPDRIAQVRLRSAEIPAELMPSNVVDTSGETEPSAQDYTHAWLDLSNKLKQLILLSFSLRVNQYEEDIKERHAQRSLPGWNFCTFFMLKEGLARGFESVGLIDDALIGYDELSLGLEGAVDDEGSQESSSRGDSFLSYTKEMKDILLQSLIDDADPTPIWKQGTPMISTTRKDYRNLIVNSNVSVFDFQCYIFARQMTILLRMGANESRHGSQQGQARPATPADNSDDLTSRYELCRRTIDFITTATRTLRRELLQAAEAQRIEVPLTLLDNITGSFSYTVAEQVLTATMVNALSSAELTRNAPKSPYSMDRLQHPARRSSLLHQPSSNGMDMLTPLKMLSQLEAESYAENDGVEMKLTFATDLQALAGARAELILIQRQVVERIACTKKWYIGTTKLSQAVTNNSQSFDEVSLQEDSELESARRPEDQQVEPDVGKRGVLHATLQTALDSLSSFIELYEALTDLSLLQTFIALRVKAFERLLVDLAIIKFEQHDYTTAAQYLAKIVAKFAASNWNEIETKLTELYMECLQKLNRRTEYIHAAMGLIANEVAQQRSIRSLRISFTPLTPSLYRPDVQNILDVVQKVSKDLPSPVALPFHLYFTDLALEPYVRHSEDEDSFFVEIKFRHLLQEEIIVDRARLKLRSTGDGIPNREVTMESVDAFMISSGVNRIAMKARVTCHGWYKAEAFELHIAQIRFSTSASRTTNVLQNLSSTGTSGDANDPSQLGLSPAILCYAASDALSLTAQSSREVHIEKSRSLEIVLSTGRNSISKATISLKAGSAGLRLLTAKAKLLLDEGKIRRSSKPGVIELQDLEKGTTLAIVVPYDLEIVLPEISIGLDCSYTTDAGTFQYMSNPTVRSELLLDVNVHDLFTANFLFSRFQFKASRGIPLLLQSIELSDTDAFGVQGPPCDLMTMLVVPAQDATMLYKISPKTPLGQGRGSAKEEKSLSLCVRYQPLQDMIMALARSFFIESIATSQHKGLQHALLSVLERKLAHIDHVDLERAALMGEYQLPNFEDIPWAEVWSQLIPTQAAKLRTWLELWYYSYNLVMLPIYNDIDKEKLENITCTLRIDVPLPRIHILQTVTLSLAEEKAYVAQGTPMLAKISVKHTRRWESKSAFKSASIASPGDSLDFMLEIDAPMDTWLIGGQRRRKFQAGEDEEVAFSIMLMPLRTGRLLMPEVVVRVAGAVAQDLRCETDYRSMGKTIQCIAGAKTTTVTLNQLSRNEEAVGEHDHN